MACRDLTRAEQAAKEIRLSTGNGNVVIRHLDLSSLYSVRQFAKDFLDSEDRLDILINNAGTSPVRLSLLSITHLSHLAVSDIFPVSFRPSPVRL